MNTMRFNGRGRSSDRPGAGTASKAVPYRSAGLKACTTRVLGCGFVGVLASGRLPIDAARILHEPADFFRVPDPHVVRFPEPVRFPGETNEARRDAAVLQ